MGPQNLKTCKKQASEKKQTDGYYTLLLDYG